MNIHSSISYVFSSLLFLLYFVASTPCPYRCGSGWSDANTKCGQCCQSRDDCTKSGDNCFAGVDSTPCQGSQTTPSPTLSTPSPTSSTPQPTLFTPSPTVTPQQITPAPTDATSSPTLSTVAPTLSTAAPTLSTPAPILSTPAPTVSSQQITPAPTDITSLPTQSTPSPSTSTPSPVTSGGSGGSASCGARCGASWTDANTKCGLCCQSRDDCLISSDNCFAGVDKTPCKDTISPTPKPTPQPSLPTASPIPVPTSSPIDGNVIGNYRLAVISGCGSGKYVSLTFDDGPAEQNDATLKIISKLNEYNIRATFYVSPAGYGDDEWGLTKRCNLIQQLTDSGNEIQSHSWKHPNFQQTQLTKEEIKIELDTVSDFIVKCGGIAPTIFRPPYGALNKEQAEYIISDLKYIIGLWNLDSNDWRSPNDFNKISTNINLNLYHDDSINILMHDRNIYDILDEIINLFNNGYQFITQSECYKRCDTIDGDGVCMDVHNNNLYILNEWR